VAVAIAGSFASLNLARVRINTGHVRGFPRSEKFLESIIKTYCTLVGLGARFVFDFQRS
jgi:hypothetical protein